MANDKGQVMTERKKDLRCGVVCQLKGKNSIRGLCQINDDTMFRSTGSARVLLQETCPGDRLLQVDA